MKAATKKIERARMKLTPQEKAIRLVCEDARQSGKKFKNPNRIIYRGSSFPWYRSRLRHSDTNQIAPFTGIGFSREEAKLDLLRQVKRAGWGSKMTEHHVTVDEETGKKTSSTKRVYLVEFAPIDSVLPERLASKMPSFGTPWHSARRWKYQDRLDQKRRLSARARKRGLAAQ